MIQNDTEYDSAVAQLAEERQRIAGERDRLKQAGLVDEQIQPLIDALEASCSKLQEQIEQYERRTADTWRFPRS
jgi:chromosome segregation ATPase